MSVPNQNSVHIPLPPRLAIWPAHCSCRFHNTNKCTKWSEGL